MHLHLGPNQPFSDLSKYLERQFSFQNFDYLVLDVNLLFLRFYLQMLNHNVKTL